MTKDLHPQCARCPFPVSRRACRVAGGDAPPFCPTKNLPEIAAQASAAYDEPSMFAFAKQASLQEAAGYADRDKGYERVRPLKPRILETIEFCGRMGYRRLGLAFCLGLRAEAKVVEKLFVDKGFEVVSAVCKVGCQTKDKLGLGDEDKVAVGPEPESMCNPILQAMLCNEAQTDFNILLGLCVGHDSMFLKHAQAMCTVLAVKDRVTGHNPLAAIYTLDSYYRGLKADQDTP